MRKLFAVALVSALSLSAQANEWAQFTPKAYTLAPVEGKKVIALATLNGDEIVVNLLDSRELCGDTSSELSPVGPYKVNGTNVKFVKACVGGSLIISPETQNGKRFFANAITSGPATVELDGGKAFHFKTENYESVKKAMLDTKSAL